MKRQRERGWVLPVSLLVALLLGVFPLPEIAQPIRPYWLALVAAYLVLELPERFNIGGAFLLGLLADMVHGSLLGEHALRLVLFTALLHHFRTRLRFFPPMQQALVLGGVMLLDYVLVAVVHLLVGQRVPPLVHAWSALTTAVMWPLVFVLLDRLRFGRHPR